MDYLKKRWEGLDSFISKFVTNFNSKLETWPWTLTDDFWTSPRPRRLQRTSVSGSSTPTWKNRKLELWDYGASRILGRDVKPGFCYILEKKPMKSSDFPSLGGPRALSALWIHRWMYFFAFWLRWTEKEHPFALCRGFHRFGHSIVYNTIATLS